MMVVFHPSYLTPHVLSLRLQKQPMHLPQVIDDAFTHLNSSTLKRLFNSDRRDVPPNSGGSIICESGQGQNPLHAGWKF